MGSSLGFVSTPCHSYALFRLAFATAPAVTALTWRQRVTRWLILQKARRHTLRSNIPRNAHRRLHAALRRVQLQSNSETGDAIVLRPLVGIRFQVLFHSPRRGSFHLSLTVLVHYRLPEVFSLGRWSSLLPTRFLVSRGTQGHWQETG
jgi:hypothetical protein